MTGFALMLALRAGGRDGNIVWLTEAKRGPSLLYGPGVAELGADPARLLFVTVPDEKMLLKAAADVVRSPAAGTAVIAPSPRPRHLDLTATRRLMLFAERSGVTVLLLRGISAETPSAAATRWRIAAAPSTPLEADAPGAPAFTVDLVKRRGGAPSPGWRLEWNRDAAAFRSAPLSGDLAADDGRRRVAG
jgi:protein ImuA